MLRFWVRRPVAISLCASICLQFVTPLFAAVEYESRSHGIHHRITLDSYTDGAHVWPVLSFEKETKIPYSQEGGQKNKVFSSRKNRRKHSKSKQAKRQDASSVELKRFMWLGRPATFELEGIGVLSWITPHLVRLSQEQQGMEYSEGKQKLSQYVKYPTSLSLNIPDSVLVLQNIFLKDLRIEANQTLIHTDVSLERFKSSSPVRVLKHGTLDVAELFLTSLQNEGVITGVSNVCLPSQGKLVNHGTFEGAAALSWYGGHFENHGTSTLNSAFFDHVSLQNNHLFQSHVLEGGFSSFLNLGNFQVSRFEDFKVGTFQNKGAFQGNGSLTLLKKSRNTKGFSGEGLSLTLNAPFINTQTLRTRELLGSGTLQNQANAFVTQLPDTFSVANTGTMNIETYTTSNLLPTSGQWIFEHLRLFKNPSSTFYCLEVPLRLKSIVADCHLITKSTIAVDEITAPCLSNLRTLEVTSSVTLSSVLYNYGTLRGSGKWLMRQFRNCDIFETFGQHMFESHVFENISTIRGLDPLGHFIFKGKKFIAGTQPKNWPELNPAVWRPVGSVVYHSSTPVHYSIGPAFPRPVYPIPDVPPLHAKIDFAGKLSIESKSKIDFRYATCYADKGLEFTTEEGDLEVGAYAPVNRTIRVGDSPTITAPNGDSVPEWREFLAQYEGGTRNGAYLATNGDFSYISPHKALVLNYGAIYAGGNMTLETPYVISKGGLMHVKGDAYVKAQNVDLTRDVPFVYSWDERVNSWSCAGGPEHDCTWWYRFVKNLPRGPRSVFYCGGILAFAGLEKLLIESSDLLGSKDLKVNGVPYDEKRPPSQFKVSPGNVHFGAESSRVVARDKVSITMDDMTLSSSLLGGTSLAFETSKLKTTSGPQNNTRNTQLISLKCEAERQFEGLLNTLPCGQMRLSVPGGMSNPCLFVDLPWLYNQAPSPLTLEARLVEWVLPTLVTRLGLQALDPRFLNTLVDNSHKVGGMLALENGEENEDDKEENSGALVIPRRFDLVAAAQKMGSFLMRQGNDLMLQVGAEGNSFLERASQGVTTLYGEESVRAVVHGPAELEGTQVIAMGRDEKAIDIEADTLVTRPSVETLCGVDNEGTIWSQLRIAQHTGFIAPSGGERVVSRGDQHHAATLFAAARGVDLESERGDVTLTVQELKAKRYREQRRKRSGFWGWSHITVFQEERTQNIGCQGFGGETFTIKAGRKATQKASRVAAPQVTYDAAEGVVFPAAYDTRQTIQTSSKDGAWSNSFIADTLEESIPITSSVEAPDRLILNTPLMHAQGLDVVGGKFISRASDMLIEPAYASQVATHIQDRSLAHRDDSIKQIQGRTKAKRPKIKFKKLTQENAQGLTRLKGIDVEVEEWISPQDLTIEDAAERTWAENEISTSGISQAWQAPSLNMLPSFPGSEEPWMIQAGQMIEGINTAISIAQDIQLASTLLSAQNPGEIMQKLASRFTTLTFGKQSQKQFFERNDPVRSNVFVDMLDIQNTHTSFQGRYRLNKGRIKTENFETKGSKVTSNSTQESEGSSFGINPLSGKITIGQNASGGNSWESIAVSADIEALDLELTATNALLHDTAFTIHDGQLNIGTATLKRGVREQKSECWSEGYSLGIPVLPQAFGADQIVGTVLGAVSVQMSERNTHQVRQEGTSSLWAVNQLTGEIRELHTQGDVKLDERNLRIGTRSHTPIAEKNDDTRWGIWAKPGEIYGLKQNMTWMGQQLGILERPLATVEEIEKVVEEEIVRSVEHSDVPPESKKEIVKEAKQEARAFMTKKSVQRKIQTIHQAAQVLEKGQKQRSHAQDIKSAHKTHTRKSSWDGSQVDTFLTEASIPSHAMNDQEWQEWVSTPRISDQEMREAETALSGAWNGLKSDAQDLADRNPIKAKALNVALWTIGTGLKVWYYAEAAALGMAAGAVGGPVGAAIGGATAVWTAYSVDNQVEAAVDAGVNAIANWVGGPNGQVIREAAPYALAAVSLKGGTKLLNKVGSKSKGKVLAPNIDKVNQVPYEPRAMERFLSGQYPGDLITSSTLPHPSMPNVKLAGKGKTIADGTHVPFDMRGFPIFDRDVMCEVKLLPNFFNKDRSTHMREATRVLRQNIEEGTVSKFLFTNDQLSAIKKGEARIPGLTWHHHQEHGRMQLLDKDFHNEVRHVGGMEMWGKK